MRLYITFLFFILSFSIQAMQNEPDGFRGIKWGDSIKKHRSKLIITDDSDPNDFSYYTRKGDKNSIGASQLKNIFYIFYKGSFSSVLIETTGLSNNSALLAAFKAKFGKPTQENPYIEKYKWRGNIADIALNYNKFSKKSSVFLYSKELIRKRNLDKKAAAKAASGDF